MFFCKACLCLCLCLCLSGICVYKYRGVAKGVPVVGVSRAGECKGQYKWGGGGGITILNDKISFFALNKF